jgi:hemoglobin-like flavoprotein
VLTIKDTAAQLFYERLFEIDPSLRELFRGDMRQQSEKLMQVMDAAVNGLSRLESIVRLIQEMGRRHVSYGVKDHHYDIVAAALLWTLDKSLGAEFTPEVKDAWATVYGVLATTMREAAASVEDKEHLAGATSQW